VVSNWNKIPGELKMTPEEDKDHHYADGYSLFDPIGAM
jgi:hypothetical protein